MVCPSKYKANIEWCQLDPVPVHFSVPAAWRRGGYYENGSYTTRSLQDKRLHTSYYTYNNHFHSRWTMASWTPARSILLSQLLDDVVGTEEMVRIRQDYCRTYYCIRSTGTNINTYYTGSKAEGLDLPGSDDDYMGDMNKIHDMQVIQREQVTPSANHINLFVMSKENVLPCFVMLRSISPIRNTLLFNACQEIDNSLYLSSYLYVHNATTDFIKSKPHIATVKQGPSIEIWDTYMDRSESGIDGVASIHCSFWPDAAAEWHSRPRKFAWPSRNYMNTIAEFGFHLVSVGHPSSSMNMMEWRISFSVAERTLVWTFNHIQMQCYAVMKLILKEFINPHCSAPCRVLCSYFIKTFLFWEYEETDSSFWCKENFRECVMRLLSNFCNCVKLRSLKHYFIPNFNLLSVKMTDEAQMEILKIFDIALQSDITAIKECKSLKIIWVECLNLDADTTGVTGVTGIEKRNLLRNGECMMATIQKLQFEMLKLFNCWRCVNLSRLTSQFINHLQMHHTVYKTHLPWFAMGILLTYGSISLTYILLQSVGNKTLYGPRRLLQSNDQGFDLSTSRLLYAMIMTTKCHFCVSLRIVNKVLSSITPFALYYTGRSLRKVSDDTKERYINVFNNNDTNVMKRARRAWMLDLLILPSHMDMVPAAIQVELKHCDEDHGMALSPFVCAYYLMFLNYCGLRQNEDRDRALRQLIDVVNDQQQCGHNRHNSYNIAGHRLLSLGELDKARHMFILSYELTLQYPAYHHINSAQYYLQCLSQNATNN